MKKKKNELHSIPPEMQATLNHERDRKIQCRRERLQKTLEFVGKKMEDEFVKAKSNNEFVNDDSTSGDALINPAQEGNDGEIISQDV